MQRITDEKLIHNQRGGLSKGARQAENNWNTIQEALDGEYETFTREIEDVLAHLNKHVDSRNQTQAIAYTLTEKLDYQIAKTTSEIQDNNEKNILVRGGSYLGGTPQPLETIYTSEGPIRMNPHGDSLDEDRVLRPNETPDNNIEAVGQRAFNPEDTGTFSPLDYQAIVKRAEEFDVDQYMGTHDWPEEQNLTPIFAHFQNTLIGENSMSDEREINIVPTHDAHAYIANQERNGNSEHIFEINDKFYNEFRGGDIDGYMRVHAEGDELQFDMMEEWNPSDGWAVNPT